MAKLEREAFITCLDSVFNKKLADSSKADFEIIGDDIEELRVELNAETEQTRNILGQTKTRDSGYSPSFDATPYYADPEKKMYPKLRDICMERLKGDACKTLLLEIIIEDTEATTHTAYIREVMVKPTSYGGSTDGFDIPFTVSEDGAWEKGTVTSASITDGAPVFTKATASV